MPITPDNLPDDPPALKRIIAAMAQDALTAQAEIARLKFQLARYRRVEFGGSSEKLAREAEQLELALEALETDQAEQLATASPAAGTAVETAAEAQKPARRPLPQHLPREDLRHPAPCTCPGCGGALRKIGDEVTETLDYVPGRFKVIRHIREKLSCRTCDTVVAAPAPDHAIARGRAGAGLLAHIVVSKYDDHLPLYRQAEIFARDGVSLETSTLSGWVGATAAALKPLVDALAADVLAGDNLHVDDTPVPVLAPGTGKTKTGRLWTYVRDERPFAGSRPPAALFFYSSDRKGEHPQAHLKDFRGVIHADGYAGFNELFAGGRIVEAACWAHVCESAWNKDPVFGVIGIQSGPPGRWVQSGFRRGYGGRVGDAGSGDNREDPSGVFRPEQADQDDLPRASGVAEGRAQGDPIAGDRVSL